MFLVTSVILAAAGSANGASRFVFDQAHPNGWTLLTAAYCLEEAQRNARKVGPKGPAALSTLIMPRLSLVSTELVFNKVLVFPRTKDRPVLLSALGANANHLLTLDEEDFQKMLGSHIYGLKINTPGLFLIAQREAGEGRVLKS